MHSLIYMNAELSSISTEVLVEKVFVQQRRKLKEICLSNLTNQTANCDNFYQLISGMAILHLKRLKLSAMRIF